MRRNYLIAAAVILLAAGCSKATQTGSAGMARFSIAVTDTGFTPGTVTIPAGKPVTLVMTRKTDQTCAKEVVFPNQGVRKPLPLDQAVEIPLPASPKGEIDYTCGMDMISGKIVVQ
jgi:plastocyanin domain-containing protein